MNLATAGRGLLHEGLAAGLEMLTKDRHQTTSWVEFAPRRRLTVHSSERVGRSVAMNSLATVDSSACRSHLKRSKIGLGQV